MMVLVPIMILLQLATGAGLLAWIQYRGSRWSFLSLAMVTGIGIQALLPFLLQLARVPLTALNIAVILIVAAFLLNISMKKNLLFFRERWEDREGPFQLYEWPCIAVIAVLLLLTIWRSYYLPPTPRDLTSGAEVIASYAVQEKSFVNSVFSVDLSTTNNQFKPPFITSMQLLYKYAGLHFGQVWVAQLALAFLVLLYGMMRKRLHPMLAGLLVVAFLFNPELFGYGFMALFDYPNAVYFFSSVAMLVAYFNKESGKLLLLSSLLMAGATYLRSETLVLAFFMALAVSLNSIRQKKQVRDHFLHAVGFMLPSVLVYFLSVTIYIKQYLPVNYSVEELVNPKLFDPGLFFSRFNAVNSKLVFSGDSVNYYGYFIFLFIIIALIDALSKRTWNREGRNYLFAVAVIYFGLPIIGHILPLMDIDNSTKRGMFKIFPLMLLYLGNSKVLTDLSFYIQRWENGGQFLDEKDI